MYETRSRHDLNNATFLTQQLHAPASGCKQMSRQRARGWQCSQCSEPNCYGRRHLQAPKAANQARASVVTVLPSVAAREFAITASIEFRRSAPKIPGLFNVC